MAITGMKDFDRIKKLKQKCRKLSACKLVPCRQASEVDSQGSSKKVLGSAPTRCWIVVSRPCIML